VRWFRRSRFGELSQAIGTVLAVISQLRDRARIIVTAGIWQGQVKRGVLVMATNAGLRATAITQAGFATEVTYKGRWPFRKRVPASTIGLSLVDQPAPDPLREVPPFPDLPVPLEPGQTYRFEGALGPNTIRTLSEVGVYPFVKDSTGRTTFGRKLPPSDFRHWVG
jgi:hypothetical protein